MTRPPPPRDERDDAPHHPRNRGEAESKLRRGGKHCPLCLAPLARNAGRTRRQRQCLACGAHPSAEKHCLRCGAAPVWEAKSGAACPRCGVRGPKRDVLAPGPSSSPSTAKP